MNVDAHLDPDKRQSSTNGILALAEIACVCVCSEIERVYCATYRTLTLGPRESFNSPAWCICIQSKQEVTDRLQKLRS
jgi:hypothetical protein